MTEKELTQAAFLWSRGHDTRDIGDRLGIREPRIVAMINTIKDRARREYPPQEKAPEPKG